MQHDLDFEARFQLTDKKRPPLPKSAALLACDFVCCRPVLKVTLAQRDGQGSAQGEFAAGHSSGSLAMIIMSADTV